MHLIGISGYFAKFVPSDGTLLQDIYYRYNGVLSYLQFEGENEPRNQIASCVKKDNSELTCLVDITGGEGLRIFRFIDANSQILGVRIVATSGSGLLNELVWHAAKDTVRTDPDTKIEIITSLPSLSQPVTLPLLNDTMGAQLAYGISD